MMRGLLIFALAAALAGCTNEAFTPTAESAARKLAQDSRRGAAREALFVRCMELAAKMPRQADDDVSDIVDACATQSFYMTNHIR